MKRYSKNDLIRKPITRISMWGIGLFSVIIGAKHIAFNGLNWKGAFIGLFGIFLLFMLNKAYENLLKEKDANVSDNANCESDVNE